MSREDHTDAAWQAIQTGRIADQLEDLNRLLRNYLRFAIGAAVKTIKASGDVPPELAGIVKDLEDFEA